MSEQELDARVRDMVEERKADEEKWFRAMEEHPRCALLPSPEKLDLSMGSPGSDETDTIGDFRRVIDWVANKGLLNVGFYGRSPEEQIDKIENSEFGSLVQLAYNNGFSAMRNTANPELEELVFWYYAGHGLGKEKATKLPYSSTPCLDRVGLDPGDYATANDFVNEGRKVKGGELCLHEIGFCDLHGLLKPWIAAVKAESINAQGVKKKNKHLVIILDSCHSGILAQDLHDFEKQAHKIDPTFLEHNSVTIQVACGPDERTFGGYFTPCFVHLNDNEQLLQTLKNEWDNMTEEARNEYRSIDLPSPMVVTTRAQPQGTTMEMTAQNFKLTLFPDAGFFKFCSIKVYQDQNERFLKAYQDRVLTPASARRFMASRPFTVLDYKLKTFQGTESDPHAGTPMGLFLLKDPVNPGYAVCAHIHFKKGDTTVHQRINIIRHMPPPMGDTLYVEDPSPVGKISVPLNNHANALVNACRNYVNQKQPHMWLNYRKWNMTKDELGVNASFRVKNERSSWEDDYLNNIEEFNLPVVSGTSHSVKTSCCLFL